MLLSAVTGYIKLALNAGKANPSPPVGPALGSKVIALESCLHKDFWWCCFLCLPFLPVVLPQAQNQVAKQRSDVVSITCLQGVNIMQFCKEYNAATQEKIGTVIPVEITVFEVSSAENQFDSSS